MTPPSYTQTRWSLKDLFPSADSPELQTAFTAVQEKVTAFEAVRSQLKEDLPFETFLGFIHQLEQIHNLLTRMAAFAQLSFTEDTQSQTAQNLMARLDQFAAEISNQTLFFSLWWKALPDEAAARLMAPAGDYTYWLEEMRHYKPHTLSEAEEKIVNIKNVTGFSAINMLYDSITNRYTFKLEVEGQTREMTRGELMIYVRQADPDLRERAYQELYRVYTADAPILGQIYQTIARDWRNEQVGMRKFSNPIASRNLANDIPDQVVDTLLDVSQKNTAVFQRFFQLKARWLKIERLRRYDIYAPVAKSEKRYSYGDAAQMTFSAFRQFDPRLAEMAERVMAKDHLDSQVRKGKMGGAFCLTAVPELTPWVLLNYQGLVDDVATMAHELGHAIHSQLASHHSLFTQHACLPLAETASTFGEMLLVDQMLKDDPSDEVRRDLLFRQMDDAFATIQRQSFFAMFERQAHEMIYNNASVDELAEAYMGNLKQQFGDTVEINDIFRWEWVAVPHFYNVPFYVYAYAFGQLLVLSLYQQYKVEGEAFKPRYLKILSTGGSQAPARTLADAGIDIYQPSFWQGGFDVLSGLVDQLEKMK